MARRRKPPPRSRKRQITVSMTQPEFDLLSAVAHQRDETIAAYLLALGVAVASDMKNVAPAAEDLIVHRNEKPGSYVTAG